MAWYYGTYSCNHEGRVNVIGPSKNRQWKIDRAFEGLCPECMAKKLQAEHDEANRKAEQEAEKMELVALTGSPKQVAWANTIRVAMIQSVDDLHSKNEKSEQLKAYAIDRLCEITEARYFIDNREKKGLHVLRMFQEDFLNQEVKEEVPEEVKEETTIKPEKTNEVVVEIKLQDNTMIAECEKNEEAIEIFKSCRMKWENRRWERTLFEHVGTYEDRAAELGNKLLNAGFVLQCQDEIVRNQAVSGNYKKECRYWIITKEKAKDSLFVKLYDRNDKYYNTAKRIKGAKWNSDYKALEVPIHNWKDVLEFADDMEFMISKKVTEAIENYKKKVSEILTVNPNECTVEEINKLEAILQSSNEVLNDLVD